MTEYVITEVGRHQWLVFADRQSIAFCADENEAVKAMTNIAHATVGHVGLRIIRQNKARRHEPAGLNSPATNALWRGAGRARRGDQTIVHLRSLGSVCPALS